jgi:Flp pilus assembly protein TadD
VTPAREPRARRSRARRLLPLAIVCACTLAVFLPVVFGEYVADDLYLLAYSPGFAGIDRLWDAVRAPFWGTEASLWRPLASATLCVGHALGGGQPWITHAFALVAHLCATVLAYAILRQFKVGTTRAAVAAAVFALHPCQVESVAWAAAIADPLAGCATLLSVWGWIRWRTAARSSLPWVAWLGFALAVASKETGATALLWIGAAEVALRRRVVPTPCIVGFVGLAVVTVLWLLMRAWVFGDFGCGFDRGQLLDERVRGPHGLLLRTYLAAALVTTPTGWLALTPNRWVPPDAAGLAVGLCALLPLVAAGVACARSAWRRRADLACLGSFGVLAGLAGPVLGATNVGHWPVADRYLYCALFGVAVILVACGQCRVPLALALVGTCAVASSRLVPHWRSQEAIAARAMADCPQHPEAHYLRGQIERRRAAQPVRDRPGQAARRARYQRALIAYQRAAVLVDQPVYGAADLRRVLGLNAELGAALVAVAGRLRPLPEVIAELQALAEREPSSSQVQLVLGVARAAAGDERGAERAWRRALILDPESPEAASNLARVQAWRCGDAPSPQPVAVGNAGGRTLGAAGEALTLTVPSRDKNR